MSQALMLRQVNYRFLALKIALTTSSFSYRFSLTQKYLRDSTTLRQSENIVLIDFCVKLSAPKPNALRAIEFSQSILKIIHIPSSFNSSFWLKSKFLISFNQGIIIAADFSDKLVFLRLNVVSQFKMEVCFKSVSFCKSLKRFSLPSKSKYSNLDKSFDSQTLSKSVVNLIFFKQSLFKLNLTAALSLFYQKLYKSFNSESSIISLISERSKTSNPGIKGIFFKFLQPSGIIFVKDKSKCLRFFPFAASSVVKAFKLII
ncbi:hypothetical protein TTHERM_000365338 (macronuclear) [Tetrahymena thermophila SB210]|uniref:Uncharacterized protein n=1 Tax=Tetrahymena thermophila (strain SB210) TaxID=312017 RepID=W7XFF0_TETTS|nr:hypothetical protein TTHERM_000365338 [Tetrahymena thermophila SB210]EWS76552.1 hypothetical protein TTHERM_000365338 [Tetrahymena thermophila SB210]|eukprot:XP_012650924.1 hypothetical protein TTHERM_000365338 [Tetrahymena thermophila SB210]